MLDRGGSRFVLEALFLVALAVGLTLAHLTAVEIGVGMLAGWAIVALVEWAAWRAAPHYGSGLPPRWYVPRLDLPPARPLEQVAVGYPEAAREEAPTWIASAALRSELLGDWPVAVPLPEPEADGAPDHEVEEIVALPAPEAPRGDEPAPEPELVVAEAAEPAPEPLPMPAVPAAVPVGRTARYSLDPLAEAGARRRFRRGGPEDLPVIEVPARPPGPRPLPGRAGD